MPASCDVISVGISGMGNALGFSAAAVDVESLPLSGLFSPSPGVVHAIAHRHNAAMAISLIL